jgi:hypothetical protein
MSCCSHITSDSPECQLQLAQHPEFHGQCPRSWDKLCKPPLTLSSPPAAGARHVAFIWTQLPFVTV